MTGRRSAGASERGFALAETLIATAIIAIMLGVCFQLIATASRANMMQRDQRRAALFAQSMLARVGADIPLAPGAIEGRTDGFDWRVQVDPYRAEGAGQSSVGQHLLHIAVSVAAPDKGGRVALQSLRFAP